MDVEDLNVYKISMTLADEVWDFVIKWEYFEKDTIGKQWVRAIDSVSANISEGFGRYSYKENRNFTFYARGSLFESRTWLKKSFNRKLIQEELFNDLMRKHLDLTVRLNNYIKTIGKKSTE